MIGLVHLLFEIDKEIFQAINSMAGNNHVLDWFIRLGADDHIIPVILTLLVLLTIPLARNLHERENAFAGLISVFIAVLISMVLLFVINNLFFRPRPFTSLEVNLLFYHNTDSSFPSNQAVLLFSMTLAVFFYNKRVAWLMLALGLYGGFSRIAAGVHYPLDIIGGILLAAASVILTRAALPVYTPLARWLTSAEYRVLCAVKNPGRSKTESEARS